MNMNKEQGEHGREITCRLRADQAMNHEKKRTTNNVFNACMVK